MKYIYVYPNDKFERNADNESIIRAWKEGEADRYTPELFAELINDEAFNDSNNWVRVIEQHSGYFEISSLHRDDLEGIGFDTRRTDDSIMRKLASKLGDNYCDLFFWDNLPFLADKLGIPKKRKRSLKNIKKVVLKRKNKK